MASRSVNRVTLLGRLGRDAELKFTSNEIAVTNFSVATSERYKDKTSGEWKEVTNWSNVVQWRAEKLAPFLVKGASVYVCGKLSTRSYEDRETGKKIYVTEVVADDVILLGGKGEGGESREPASAPRGKPLPDFVDDGSDVPF